MRRIDLLWKIVEYRASLLGMFNVYEFCCFNLLRKTCNAFLFNEAVLKFAKLPCLRIKVKICNGEQIHLKTELKLLNNLNLFCFINYIKTRTVLYRKKQFIV
jgi:hypothetical protein